MNTQCVSPKDKYVISLQNKYNASFATIENIIHSWWIKTKGKDFHDNEDFISYLEGKLGIGSIPITSKSTLNKIRKIRKALLEKYINFPKSKIKEVLAAVSALFEESDFSIYETLKKGIYTLSIKEPSFEEKGKLYRTSVSNYTGNITPDADTIFVFGSNPEGRHGAGAAKIAREQFGAIYGQGEGLQGNAYALPTKDLRVKENNSLRSISPEQIIESIKKLYETARQNPDKQFKIAYRNTDKASLNGYTGLEMIDMFLKAGSIPTNIVFSKEWVDTGKFNLSREASSTKKSSIIQGEETFKEKETPNKLEESRNLVQQIIENSERRISFDKDTHTYTVDGKKADTSVTEYIHGKTELGLWKTPSTALGDTVDAIVRDFFKGKLKKSYPNLTKEQLKDLVDSLNNFKKYLDKTIGGKYEVVTEEFAIASKYTEVGKDGKHTTKVMAGTMDMLVYDDKGNFYIFDMKTARSGIYGRKQVGYSKQLNLYRSILEANYPQLKGKIKKLELIEFSLYYPDPYKDNVSYYDSTSKELKGIKGFKPKEGQLYVVDSNGDIFYIQDFEGYESPKYKNPITLENKKVINEMQALDKQDREILGETLGNTSVPVESYTPSQSTLSNLGWDNSPLLSASEKRFLSNQVMYLTSYIISHLQNNKEANRYYLGNTYSRYDFTKMSREDIISTVGIGSIFNYVKETFFNPDNRIDIKDFDTLDKLQVAFDNFEAMARQGYSKLITLEGTNGVINKPEFIKTEDIEESLDGEYEHGSLEEKVLEYWQQGQRQISAKSSLSTLIRRMFERLKVVDKDGNPVKDSFGFNMDTFIDSNLAVNSILTWVNNASTMQEMEEVLESMEDANPWLSTILSQIKEEPVRSQFFQNFRKDFTHYSVITVEYDSKGNRKYVNHIVNTKGAFQTLKDDIVSRFHLGQMPNLITPLKGDLEGRGSVNTKKVKYLQNIVSTLIKNLETFSEVKNKKGIIDGNISEVVGLLNNIGVPVNESILKSAFASDSKCKTFKGTKMYKILNSIGYMLDILMENKNNKTYNPIIKGEEGNIYSNYKTVLTELSSFIQDSIESSTYENGKTYYSFTTPSYMGKLISKLSNKLGDSTKFNEFLENEYGSYKWFKNNNTWNCPWLELLSNSNSKYRDMLQHKVQLSFDKTDYTELSELGYTLSLMHEYFYDKGKEWAWYRLPILANKPSSEFVRFVRYSEDNYKDTIIKGFRKVFNQELMRIRTVLERADNPNVEKIGAKGKVWFDIKEIDPKVAQRFKKGTLTANDLSLFSGTGAEFKFLSPLNNHIKNNTALGKLIVDKINNKKVDENKLNKLFKEAVHSFMNEQMKVERALWSKMGLYETVEVTKNVKGKKQTETKYKYLSQFGNSIEEIESNLENYVWNDTFATMNIIELTATDLAYYKNVEDFQKRYAQVHSPSLRLNTDATFKDSKGNITKYSADGLSRTIYLKDDIIPAEITPNVEKIFNDKISTLSGQDKINMEVVKATVLDTLKSTNVADAQGYSSPTSYRKKLGMQGRWTEEMEEAYNQIIKGNLNIDNFNVIWQPLKPFVYSQIRKSSGAVTMSELKVPVQNKNSEYMLLIADAIMRSGNQSNKLQAIFDFMEESAYTGKGNNKKYNGIGIDTVQFISAVNSGGMGAIDITGDKSYNTVKNILESAAYYNKNRTSSTSNAGDIYNEQYVHTIPFEDYGIQQEVPAHMSDHKQPMGSQVRILSVSDITEGTVFNINGKEIERDTLLEEYFNLHSENITESYNQLKEDLGVGKSRKERNVKLSQLLQESILKDQRYGSDLLRACSLDENDEFILPPSDPMHSTRIQQLLNSIIKSRINKQEVQGGPAVQVSSFGLSDSLNIVWKDSDGNLSTSKKFNIKKQKSVAYFECYAPIPTKEMEEALLKPDGSYMTPEEAVKKGIISEEMLKAIAYRIPTEDKYSIIPMVIKGFVPKAAGEVVILPKDITTLTGSDFDIDKMYIMFKEFKRKESINWIQLEKDILSTAPDKRNKKYINAVKIAIDEIKNGNIVFSEGSFEEKVYDFYIKNINKYRTVKFEDKKLSKKGTRNNRIFDIQWAVLTHPDTAIKMFNPGSFDVQKRTARIINILKSSGKYTYDKLSKMSLDELTKITESNSNLNIVFPSTQVYFHKQNMTAAKLIGIFANNNTSHAFLSMQDIYFNIEDEKAFTFNGITINKDKNNKIDALEGKDGTLISKTIAGFLAASVDAVKDPVLNYINLNTMTANPAMVLARLGFDSDSIGLLLTQPIIEKLSNEYFKRNNEGYISVEDLIDEILEERDIDYDIYEKNLNQTLFTKEEMAIHLTDKNIYSDFQIRTLLLFKRLTEMGKDLNTLTFLTKFNSVTNATGPTIADTLVMKERYEKFLEDMESKIPPFSESAKDVINNNPMLKAFYESTVGDKGASAILFSDFPHYSEAFTNVLSLYRNTTKNSVSSKTINKLIQDFILYVATSGENPVLDGSYDNRNRFINKFVTEFYERTKDISGNDFINIINTNPRTKKCPIETIGAKTGGYNIDVQERVKDGWSNLLSNSDTYQLGLDLFYYSLFRSGFNFTPKGFGHLSSVDVKRAIPEYINLMTSYTGIVSPYNFLQQFKRNHTQDKSIVPVFTPSKRVTISESKNVKGNNIVIFSSYKKLGLRPIIVSESTKEVTYVPVINYNDKIYILESYFGDSVSYVETTPLGNPNNFLEYDANNFEIESVIQSNVGISNEEEEDGNYPSNPSNQYEKKKSKAYNAKDIEKAILQVFDTKEARNLDTKEEVIDYVSDKVLKVLGASKNLKQVIERKVEEILDKFCKS